MVKGELQILSQRGGVPGELRESLSRQAGAHLSYQSTISEGQSSTVRNGLSGRIIFLSFLLLRFNCLQNQPKFSKAPKDLLRGRFMRYDHSLHGITRSPSVRTV